MKKQQNLNTNINLFFSAFLITASVICSYFFTNFAVGLGPFLGSLIKYIVFIILGLILFYATRVGDGRSVRRFSIATLLVLDLPTIIILLIGLINQLPLHDKLVTNSYILVVAALALGYGIPYTFFSGFELIPEDLNLTLSDSEIEPESLEFIEDKLT